MEEILFTKMHGIGNDYIYINCLCGTPSRLPELAVEMSSRHTGVGADGIILIMPSEVADFRMRMFNADGSEGRMCGNASRCIGKYVHDKGLTDKDTVTLETLAGIRTLQLHMDADGTVGTVTVDMGEPILDCKEVPVEYSEERMIDVPVPTSAGTFRITAVSMGNPHGVIFIDTDPMDVDVHGIGRELEVHPMWPDRANIEFARVMSDTDISMRVWERGSGETMACGTGACATAVAAHLCGLTGRKVTVHLRGGRLTIDWDKNTGHVYMTGPATAVMEGRYFRKN
ncbi:MAG: diaminopimelate epimerase [Muribaculaceae bacterium]|nr:diaminopimelate epimerase [Muribaculaceae bacterium]